MGAAEQAMSCVFSSFARRARTGIAGAALVAFAAAPGLAQVWGAAPEQTQQVPRSGQSPPDPREGQPGQYPGDYPQDPRSQRGVVWPPPKPPARPPAPTARPSGPITLPEPSPEPVAYPVKDKNSRLSEETKLELIRYVSGEFAKARTPLPGGKKAFKFKAGQPLDQKGLIKALQDGGVAISPGDDVQITKLDFGGSEIVVELNGGGPRRSWRDRIQISGGVTGAPVPSVSSTSTTDNPYGPVAAASKPGISLVLDFGRPLPEMTPDELKLYLSNVLDFSKQRSAAVTWAESQPPEIRQAIAEKRALVGMDPDQVMAALGRADKKVRERLPDGTDTEDWIYGTPPGKTIFVKFAHERVIRIDQYPR